MASSPIAAAGAVVWRRRGGSVEIAVIHRPKYDDWSLPKGKLEPGETELGAAVREVGEEIGARVAVSRRVGRVRYLADDVPKTVTYWAMEKLCGSFLASEEVDDLEWLAPAKARKRLDYDVDRAIVDDFTATPPADALVILLRHAHAGRRKDWSGEDRLRPLDDVGRQQARRMTEVLRWFAPDRIVSAEPVRCVQTVEPLAAALGLSVEVNPLFGDESYQTDNRATHAAVRRLLGRPGTRTVICSQGVTIPSLIDVLAPEVHHADTRKGAAWVVSAAGGKVVASDYYEAAPVP